MDQKEKAPGVGVTGGGGPIQGKDGFMLYKSFYGPISRMTVEQKGRLLDAIFQWQIAGTEESVSDDIKVAFDFFKFRFEADNDKYLEMCRRKQEYGKLGGRPPKANGYPESIRLSGKQKVSEKAKEADRNRIGEDGIGEGFNDTALSGASLNPKWKGLKVGSEAILKDLED